MQNGAKSSRFGDSICDLSLSQILYNNYRYISLQTRIKNRTIYKSNLLQLQISYKLVRKVELLAVQSEKH